jgi:hypothetical protein
MTNKNLPDQTKDKKTDRTNGPADKNTPEMGSSRAVNQGGNSGSHPEASDKRRGPERKSETGVPNAGRDITTGSDGFDGQGRRHDGDEDRGVTNDDHKGDVSAENEQRNIGDKGTKG